MTLKPTYPEPNHLLYVVEEPAAPQPGPAAYDARRAEEYSGLYHNCAVTAYNTKAPAPARGRSPFKRFFK